MKGFIELTIMRDNSSQPKPIRKVCFNVKGIECFRGNRVVTLSGDVWPVEENFTTIKHLVEEALKEE